MKQTRKPEPAATRPGTKPLERRSFLVRLMGLGLLPLTWMRVIPPAKPEDHSRSRKADFWRKGSELAG